jgi:hypothetical protein
VIISFFFLLLFSMYFLDVSHVARQKKFLDMSNLTLQEFLDVKKFLDVSNVTRQEFLTCHMWHVKKKNYLACYM